MTHKVISVAASSLLIESPSAANDRTRNITAESASGVPIRIGFSITPSLCSGAMLAQFVDRPVRLDLDVTLDVGGDIVRVETLVKDLAKPAWA